MERDHNGTIIRTHKTQIVERRCGNETCFRWFIVSDDLFEQQFCCKPCKKTQNNRERRRRDQKVDSVVAMALAYQVMTPIEVIHSPVSEELREELTHWEPF